MSKSVRVWVKWGGIAVFIGWLFFSLSAYYVVQKPFSVPQMALLAETAVTWQQFSFSVTAVGRSLLDVVTALWITWFALGTGLWLLDRFALTIESNLERILFGLGLGFGGLGLLILFLGLVGWLETAVFYAVAIILTFLTSQQAFALLRQLKWERPPRLTALYLLLTLGFAFFLALLPPTSWDSLSYHLQGPRLYLQTGRIIPGPDIMPLHYPSLFEMLFMMALALRGDTTATLLHFIFVIPLGGLVWATTRHHLHGSARDGWTAVLILIAIPMIPLQAAWAYNDLALAFYQLAALYAFLHWRKGHGRVKRGENWLILAGVMAGLAMGLKYWGIVAPFMVLIFIAWEHRQTWREGIRPFLLFSVPALFMIAPWLVKNWFFTNNPVYPFLFVNGRYWDAYRAAENSHPGTGIGFDIVALLRLPYDLTLGYKDITQDGPLGPLFLMFLPLLLGYGLTKWRKRPSPAFHYLLLMAFGQYLLWTIGVISSKSLWQSRYLLPGLVTLSPVLAWILADLKRWDHPQFSMQRFLRLTVGVAVSLGLVGQILVWLPTAPLTYTLGDETRESVLYRQLGAYYGAMTAVNELPTDAHIVFLWEPRSYYCQRDCQPDIILDKLGQLAYLHGNADAIAAVWRHEGITHLLLHQAGLNFFADDMPKETAVLEDLQADYLNPITDIGGAYILYELQP